MIIFLKVHMEIKVTFKNTEYSKYSIMLRSMQYSVWYKTENGPTVVYEPNNKSVPHGMDFMREHIQLHITSHNRYWYAFLL